MGLHSAFLVGIPSAFHGGRRGFEMCRGQKRHKQVTWRRLSGSIQPLVRSRRDCDASGTLFEGDKNQPINLAELFFIAAFQKVLNSPTKCFFPVIKPI